MKAILTEELFHMYTSEGLAKVFPTKFGLDWNSKMCKNVAKI